MSIQILSAAQSDIGPRKSVNQDSFYHATEMSSGIPAGIYAVADGVSSSAHGEVASGLCVAAIDRWWREILPSMNYEKSKVIPAAADLIIGINKTVCDTKVADGGRSASTLTLLLLLQNEWFTFNAGDSRIYRLRKGIVSQLDQLTVDHSCLVEREYNGEKYLKSVLTSCIGGRNTFQYGYSSGTLREGDRFLLCSDGIYRTGSPRQIKKILGMKNADPNQVCENLIRAALSNGETDNITAVTVFCQGKEGA